MYCTVCHRQLQSIENLIKHMKATHPYEASFQCGFPKCFRKYVNIESLKKHFNTSHKKLCNNSDASSTFTKRFTTVHTDEASSSSNTDTLNITTNKSSNVQVDRNVTNISTVDDTILKFIAKLYSNSSITRNVVQTLVDDCSELVQDLLSYIKCKLQSETFFSNNNISEVLDNVFYNIKPFEKYSTEYRRLQFFKKSKWLVQPQKFLLGEMFDNSRNKNNFTTVKSKKCEGQFISLRESLKQYLELPGVFMSIKSYIAKETAKEKAISSIFCGNMWKNLVTKFDNKILLPLLLYYDDFETGNPLGSRASIHKLGGLYYTIAGIPKAHASSLENIFLGTLIYSGDRETFGNKMSFKLIINELIHLENYGIYISVDN